MVFCVFLFSSEQHQPDVTALPRTAGVIRPCGSNLPLASCLCLKCFLGEELGNSFPQEICRAIDKDFLEGFPGQFLGVHRWQRDVPAAVRSGPGADESHTCSSGDSHIIRITQSCNSMVATVRKAQQLLLMETPEGLFDIKNVMDKLVR